MSSRSPSDLLDPRHVAAAVAIGLIVQVVSLGAVGLAVASDEATDPAPEPFSVPRPRVGDRGTYNVTIVDKTGNQTRVVAEVGEVLSFAVEAPDLMRDGAGDLRRAWTVRHGFDGDPRSSKEKVFTQETATHHDPLAERDFAYTRFHENYREYDRGDTRRTSWRSTYYMNTSSAYADDRNAPCGIWSVLQGDPVPLDDTVDLFEGCYVVGTDRRVTPVRTRTISYGSTSWGGGYPGDDVTFTPVAGQGTGEDRVVKFTWKDETRSGHVFEQIDVWFRADIPYPVKIETARSPTTSGLFAKARLTGWDRGDGPVLETGEKPDPDPAPPVELAKRERWGPSEEGVDHPFPLSEALARARDNPGNDTLRAFLEDHPDAYVARAQTAEHFDESTAPSYDRSWWWGFVVTDGRRALEISAWRHLDDARGALGEEAGVGTPDLPGDYDFDYEWETREHRLEDMAPPGNMPEEVPTVASVMDRWRAYRRPLHEDREANSWGFMTQCADPDEGCQEVWFRVSAGWDAGITYGPPVVPDHHEWNSSELTVSRNGETRWLAEQVQHDTYPWSDPAPSPSDDEDPAPAATAAGRVGTELWTFPSEHAATLGAAALVAGLIYWLWPLVKSLGLAPLYTRLDRDDVLDHPVRQRIVETVSKQPGIHRAELARRLDLADGTVRHHLDKLVEADLVVANDDHGFVCYFRPGDLDASIRRGLAALTTPAARKVLQALVEDPGRSNKELAGATGLSPSTVHHHVGRLRDAGLVEGRRQGRSIRLSPTDTAERALAVRSG